MNAVTTTRIKNTMNRIEYMMYNCEAAGLAQYGQMGRSLQPTQLENAGQFYCTVVSPSQYMCKVVMCWSVSKFTMKARLVSPYRGKDVVQLDVDG